MGNKSAYNWTCAVQTLVQRINCICIFFSFAQFPNSSFFPSDENYFPKVCISKNWLSGPTEDGVEHLHLKGTEKVSKFLSASFGVYLPIIRGLQ